MIEAGAKEVPEQQMIDAIFAAHELNQKVIAFIDTHRGRVRQAQTCI